MGVLQKDELFDKLNTKRAIMALELYLVVAIMAFSIPT